MNIEIMLLVWLFLIGTTLSARVAIRLAIAVTYGRKRIRARKRLSAQRRSIGCWAVER
jgi:hypothetical protein